MKKYHSWLAAVCSVLSASALCGQEFRGISFSGQTITPYRIEVAFSKTTHILFPASVLYVDLGSTDIIAGKAAGVENVVRVKATKQGFEDETNFSVITSDGHFYSFDVVYSEQPRLLSIDMAVLDTANRNRTVIQLRELDGEAPENVDRIMEAIYRDERSDIRSVGCFRFRVQSSLKGVYVYGDLMFFHLAVRNMSDIPFDVDFIRFKIVDRKVSKRTAAQEIYLDPLRVFGRIDRVETRSSEHGVYAFTKITIPDDKKLVVEIYEKGGERHQRFDVENRCLASARRTDELKTTKNYEKQE
ncbi:MAG: conjugative transposon protein TraN [Christensenellales bacterium]